MLIISRSTSFLQILTFNIILKKIAALKFFTCYRIHDNNIMPSALFSVFNVIDLDVCSAACIWRFSWIITAFASDVNFYGRAW